MSQSLELILAQLVAAAEAEAERSAQIRSDIRAMFAGIVSDKEQGIRVRDRIRADNGKARRVRELLMVTDSSLSFGETDTIVIRKDVPSRTYDLVCHHRSKDCASYSSKVRMDKKTMKGLLAMLLRAGCIE